MHIFVVYLKHMHVLRKNFLSDKNKKNAPKKYELGKPRRHVLQTVCKNEVTTPLFLMFLLLYCTHPAVSWITNETFCIGVLCYWKPPIESPQFMPFVL